MNKIKLIIQREYLTRVKKKSFVIMTLLGPLLMAAVMIVPVYLASVKDEAMYVKVIDETTVFIDKLEDNTNTKFDYSLETIEQAKATFYKEPYSAILYLPRTVLNYPEGVMLYYKKEPGIMTKSNLEKQITKELQKRLLEANSVDKAILDKLNDNVKIRAVDFDEDGKEKEGNSEIKSVLGYLAGFLIYMFIFLYGVQVMRGVIEEKTNRIIEVIISSVKPFQLMMGKIVGIALVGLTQFLLWIVLTVTISTTVSTYILKDKYSSENIKTALAQNGEELSAKQKKTMEGFSSVLDSIKDVNFPLVITCFIIYFLGGYLLYSALFAAVGSAVDNETETQQFMLPVTIPLIIGIVVLQMVLNNPDGPVAFWFSIIPLTSPVVMMARIPFGVPIWQIALSISLLIGGFLAATWLAGRIYRTGILMYGKKVTYKELGKWLFYRD